MAAYEHIIAISEAKLPEVGAGRDTLGKEGREYGVSGGYRAHVEARGGGATTYDTHNVHACFRPLRP